MRSSLPWLRLKLRKKDKETLFRQEEITFASWNSGGKGNGIAPQLNGTRCFSFEELEMYSDNFSRSNLIGSGGYGKVYKGYLPNGIVVAIRRIPRGSFLDAEEFKNEIELLSRAHHPNVVSLVGFSFEQGERMLVYKYIPKGSLHDNLYGNIDIDLDWTQRLRIALDSARGLAYLHELANPQIIHRDVKSTNILLDENLNAKLIGFVFSKLNRDKQERHVSTQDKRMLVRTGSAVKGTFGYLDPEYFKTQQLSEKSDVYGFGIVMLELLTAKKPIIYDEEGNTAYIVEKIKIAIDMYDQDYYGLRDMIDPKIVNQAINIGLRKFVLLALACVEECSLERPSMHEVMKEIEIIQNASLTLCQNYDDWDTATNLPLRRSYNDFDNSTNLPSRQSCRIV